MPLDINELSETSNGESYIQELPLPSLFITKDTFSFTQTLTLGTPFALQK